MALSKMLLPEFDTEMAGTRRTLERVPMDKADFKPHPKSATLGWLAGHVANIPSWATIGIKEDSFDVAPAGGEPMKIPEPKTREELMQMFDKNVAEARAALAGAMDEHLMQSWTLLSGGRKLMTIPRTAVLRTFVLNHMIHHRAQLGVYLRLNDVPVPALYGGSADEAPQM